jgi:hypothetical protein
MTEVQFAQSMQRRADVHESAIGQLLHTGDIQSEEVMTVRTHIAQTFIADGSAME